MPFQIPPPDTVTIESLKGPSVVQTDSSLIYEGNVVVRYNNGSSKVLADRLVVYEGRKVGVAEGHVTLIDPVGTATADRIEFGWDPLNRYGKANNVEVRVGNGILRARRAEFSPKSWELFDAEGTTCLEPRPVYYVTSDHITVEPNKQARIHQPRLSVLGRYVAQLPNQQASLIQAAPGIHLPSPTYKSNRGFGLRANGGLAIGKNSIFSYNSRVFVNRRFSGLAQYTHSFLPLENATQVVPPRSDLSERFAYGFLNSLNVKRPEEEQTFLRARRTNLGFSGQINGSVADRARGRRYDRIEAVYQVGGAEKGIGYIGEARFQGLQPTDGNMSPRLKLIGVANLPIVEVAPKLRLLTRLDSEAFLGKTAYGWGQLTSGLAFQPNQNIRLSAGGFLSGDLGTAQYAMDPLYVEKGLMLRSDVAFGGFSFSYLIKRAADRGTYDHEFAFRQVVGCFEVFYAKREYPRDRRVGINLRVQPFVDLFKRRIAQATKKPVPDTPPRTP